jgi:hypothetical protein
MRDLLTRPPSPPAKPAADDEESDEEAAWRQQQSQWRQQERVPAPLATAVAAEGWTIPPSVSNWDSTVDQETRLPRKKAAAKKKKKKKAPNFIAQRWAARPKVARQTVRACRPNHAGARGRQVMGCSF